MADEEKDSDAQKRDAAVVVWEGDCLEVVRTFPKAIREDLGADIRRLQLGERPLSSRPMRSIGPGVFELRQMDDKGWYRTIYLSKVANRIYMLHSFVKKSAKTSQNDLRIATARLKAVRARLRTEKKNAQKTKPKKSE
jgi:phage-related protein